MPSPGSLDPGGFSVNSDGGVCKISGTVSGIASLVNRLAKRDASWRDEPEDGDSILLEEKPKNTALSKRI
jgi:hypothetical protein